MSMRKTEIAVFACLLVACGAEEPLTVAHAVDGDTIELSSGETVRLIGVDTPESGECGYGEATQHMSEIARGYRVTLIPGARDDRDQYGRLLRYVEVDGQDVGLAQINNGYAIARYDSRDGYGAHPRESDYVAADAASDKAPCSTSFTYIDPPPSSCAGRFNTCREAKSAGCGPYYEGETEYAWYQDGDNDGVVCE